MEKVLKSPEFNLGYEIFTGDELPIRKERFLYIPNRKMVRYYRITRIIYWPLLFLLGLGALYYIANIPERIPAGFENFMEIYR